MIRPGDDDSSQTTLFDEAAISFHWQVLGFGGAMIAIASTTALCWWLLYEFWMLLGKLL